MKKYKFRGKRIDNREWALGDLLQTNEGSLCIGIHGQYIDDGMHFNEMYDETPYIEENTVGQFTGMTDCDKTDIYEGDILIEPSVATIPLEVRYNETQCAFCLVEHTHTEGPLLGTSPLGDMLRHYPSMKVVGNIHDNPEILTKWQTK